jgi:threonylcarbamoyladenosine tRNA methylthiotransferase MtaB
MASVYVKTLGCKVNTFDGHALENQFRARGYELVSEPDGADVTVVNTCSVTANAEREARYLARRLRRESPDTMLVFTGCYAQTDSARLVAMDEIDLVIPNVAKERLVDTVTAGMASLQTGEKPAKLPEGVAAVAANKQAHFKSSVTLFDKASSEQTRAFVKVQDGCNGFCTYCLIPYARGASRSVPRDQVINECERLVAEGVAEIVLTGIHIGDYGRDLVAAEVEADPIVGLVEDILKVAAPRRLRISSLEPAELSPALVEALAARREQVCDHLHLPLQSGSQRILKLMRRTYDPAGYADAVHRFRAQFPDGCVGADVIPGFPGESDEDFAATVELIRSLELSYLHVFPYSQRPNTAAVRMPGHLPADVIKARASELRRLSDELAANYARKFIGRTLPVLWEKDLDDQGRRLGHTPNYLSVVSDAAKVEAGCISFVQLKGLVGPNRLLGRALH